MLNEVGPKKTPPRSGPGSPVVMKDFPIVLKSSPGRKFPRPDPGSPTHRYAANSHCFLIQPQKKVLPARSKFPHTPLCTEIHLFKKSHSRKKSPRPEQGSPTPRYVTPRHVTPCHVSSRHVASCHVTSRHRQRIVIFRFGGSVPG